MYEVNFELNHQSIDVNLDLQQSNINADLTLNVLPDKTSQLANDSGYITTSDLIPLENDIVDIENDIYTLQSGKVDKVSGKGLSTNDFTNALKSKLEGIEAGAEVNKVNSVNGQTGDVVIEIPDSATWGNITGTLSNQTDLQTALNSKQGNLTATYGLTLNNNVISGKEITDVVDGISAVIPAQATEQNKLADKNFVNSSISTNTANFIGTFNSVADLEAYSGTVTNNDYAFVVGTDSAGNTVYNRYKYTTATTPASWIFEYALNNSSFTSDQWASINSGITSGDVTAIGTALQPNDNISDLYNDAGYITSSDLSGLVPYSNATGAVDLNGQDLKNIDNLAVGTATIDSNEKILSVGQNRFVTNNQNGLFISSTTSQTRKGMYGVPMALEIQFNSNNQAYSYPLGFHDMNSNGNGGQFLFTSFSSAIGAASAGDVMVEMTKAV